MLSSTPTINRIFDARDKRKAKLKITEAAIYHKNTCSKRKRVENLNMYEPSSLSTTLKDPRLRLESQWLLLWLNE